MYYIHIPFHTFLTTCPYTYRELCGCCCKGKFAFNKAATKVIRNEYEKLGKLRYVVPPE